VPYFFSESPTVGSRWGTKTFFMQSRPNLSEYWRLEVHWRESFSPNRFIHHPIKCVPLIIRWPINTMMGQAKQWTFLGNCEVHFIDFNLGLIFRLLPELHWCWLQNFEIPSTPLSPGPIIYRVALAQYFRQWNLNITYGNCRLGNYWQIQPGWAWTLSNARHKGSGNASCNIFTPSEREKS